MTQRASQTLERLAVAVATAPAVMTAALTGAAGDLQRSSVRRDPWVQFVVIGIALIIAVGLMVAWWIVCQNRGMWPAMDMPSFSEGGTWKVYCRA